MKQRSLALALPWVWLAACQSTSSAPADSAESGPSTETAPRGHFGPDRVHDGLTHLKAGAGPEGRQALERIAGQLIGPDAQPLVGTFRVAFTAEIESTSKALEQSLGTFEITTDEFGRFDRELGPRTGIDLSRPAQFVIALAPADRPFEFTEGGLYTNSEEFLVAHFLHRPDPQQVSEEYGYRLDLEVLRPRAMEAALVLDAREMQGPFTLQAIPNGSSEIELPWEFFPGELELRGGAEHVLYSTPGAEGWQLRAVSELHGTIDLGHAAPGDTVVLDL